VAPPTRVQSGSHAGRPEFSIGSRRLARDYPARDTDLSAAPAWNRDPSRQAGRYALRGRGDRSWGSRRRGRLARGLNPVVRDPPVFLVLLGPSGAWKPMVRAFGHARRVLWNRLDRSGLRQRGRHQRCGLVHLCCHVSHRATQFRPWVSLPLDCS